MGTILNLLKLQIDNKTDILKARSPGKMIVALLKVLLLLTLITVGLMLLFSRFHLIGIRVTTEFLAVILLVTQAITLIFAVPRPQSNLQW